MSPETNRPSLSTAESIPLIALLISLDALSADAMLPALSTIAQELGAARPNHAQFVITSLFLGLGIGQMLFGPLSDRIGRKPAIYTGLALFMTGCLVSLFASSFETMIAARVLQGIGVAAPHVVSMALVRDQYEGRLMARLMSLVLAVFVLVPTIAPALGQLIMLLSGWRAIFVAFLVLSTIALTWLAVRQPETLPAERRLPFSLRSIARAVAEIVKIRAAIGYTLASGLIFAPFVAYLSSAQQIFQQAYDTGALFPAYFASLALAIGIALLVNQRMVIRLEMHMLCKVASTLVAALSLAMWAGAFAFDGLPPAVAFHGLPRRRLHVRRRAVRQPHGARNDPARAHRRSGGGSRRIARHPHLGSSRHAHWTAIRRNDVRADWRIRTLRRGGPRRPALRRECTR